MAWHDLLAEGKRLFAAGKLRPAVEVLARAAALAPAEPAVIGELGIAQKLAGDVVPARATLERALALVPADRPDLAQRFGFVLALTHGDLDDREAALAAFECVRAVAPESPLGETALYYIHAYRERR